MTLNIGKNSVWTSIVKKEIHPSSLKTLGIDIPSGVSNVFNISAKKLNEVSVEFYLLKDKFGKNLGSRSIYSNGFLRNIDIEYNPIRTDGHNGLSKKDFISDNKIYTNHLFLNGKLQKRSSSFLEVFRNFRYFEDEKFIKSNELAVSKKINNLSQTIVRIKELVQKGGARRIFQELLQIEENPKIKRYLKIDSLLKKDGEINLNSYAHSKNLQFDSNNPYFQIGLLNYRDMLKARYKMIAKECRCEGIEPPLFFENNKKAFDNSMLGRLGGIVPNDNSFIGVNCSLAKDKVKLVQILGHECEHLFKQNAIIHLAGLKNMMSENFVSKRFYKGIENRLRKIEKGTDKYRDAEIFLYEKMNYINLVLNNGKLDADKHNQLYKEQLANLAGDVEIELFQKYIADIKKNFSLFNTNYALKK